LVDGSTFKQLHHDEHRPGIGYVVVEDGDSASMPNAISGSAFAERTLLRAMRLTDVRVKYLHGGTSPVSMDRGVDGAGSTNAKQ
jgi:hypothetical protein